MTKFKLARVGLGLVLVATMIIAVLVHIYTPSPGEASGASGNGYTFGSEAGEYSITLDQFKRHGPHEIERNPFQLEEFKQVLSYTVAPDTSISEVSVSITSKDEASEYRLDLSGDRYMITDLVNGTTSDGPTVSTSSLTPPGRVSAVSNLPAVLEQAGYSLISTIPWNGRSVDVYEVTGSIVGQLQRPESNGPIGLPVIYDLAPSQQRAGIYVDTAAGVAIRSYRYAIDTDGNETLIESFEVQSIERK